MKNLSNEELELRFEAGEDMGDFMDGATARVIKPFKTVNPALWDTPKEDEAWAYLWRGISNKFVPLQNQEKRYASL